MLLSGAVFVVWQFFFPAEPPPTGDETVATEQVGETGESDSGDSSTTVTTSDDADADPDKDGAEDKPVADVDLGDVEPVSNVPVRTDNLLVDSIEISVSNKGGRVVSATVTDPERYKKAGDLLATFPEGTSHYPFGLHFAKGNLAIPDDLTFEVVEDESEKTDGGYNKIVYRHVDSQGRYVLDKIYTVQPDEKYRFDLDVKLTNLLEDGRITEEFGLDVYGYNDPEEESSFLDVRADEVEAICKVEGDLEREMIGSVEESLIFDEFPVLWAGTDKRYFLFAALPAEEAELCSFEVVDKDYLRTRMIQHEVSVGPGESKTASWKLFVGPKDYDLMESVGRKLQESVDFGILTFIARPLRAFLVWIQGFVGNWGIAIIILTLIIRLLLWPINHKVYANGEKMKEIQPQLSELREKYKNDQQRMTEETMKLMREAGASPLGCLPMFLQFPILLALYFMILNSVELYQANFALWYTDLSASDPYFVLPVLMGIVMFVQQSMMTPAAGGGAQAEQMQKMMKFMPIMFTAFMLFLPSGVVLYYFVSLLIGLAQQFYIRRSFAQKREAEAA